MLTECLREEREQFQLPYYVRSLWKDGHTEAERFIRKRSLACAMTTTSWGVSPGAFHHVASRIVEVIDLRHVNNKV